MGLCWWFDLVTGLIWEAPRHLCWWLLAPDYFVDPMFTDPNTMNLEA